jgi:hypothetical protein
MAELSEDEKNRISHRARAFIAMRPLLEAELERLRGAAKQAPKAEREPSA